MTLPTHDIGSTAPSYMHLHVHTGTTSATPLRPSARAFMVINQAGNITIKTPEGSETFAAGVLPVDTIIPVQVMSITLANAADDVLLLW